MARLTIDTANGAKVLIPGQISGIASTNQYGAIAVVHHGRDRARSVYLDADEVRMMIGVTWQPRRCPSWGANACWAGRQRNADAAPPPSCVGCQLRAILMDQAGDDLRMIRESEPHPLKVPVVVSLVLMSSVWLIGQTVVEGSRLTDARNRELARENAELRQEIRQKRGDRTPLPRSGVGANGDIR